MLRNLPAILLATLLLGCDEQTDYYADGQTVMIDDREFFVRQPPSQPPNVYVATLNRAPADLLWKRDFSLPAFNIRAIEKVTKCKVDPATVHNTSVGTTFAAVNC